MLNNFRNKFMIKDFKIYSNDSWTWSIRPSQQTLGSGIISLNRECESFSDVTNNEMIKLNEILKLVESTLSNCFHFDKINYLCLMMVDPQLHIHVIPRYAKETSKYGDLWIDTDWPRGVEFIDVETDINIIEMIKDDLITEVEKQTKYTVGYTTGVFDMFHVGHLNLLKKAKENCDYLIVGVTTDELVSYKNTKAIISHKDRMEIVRSCKYVDEVVSQESMDKMSSWEKLKFDVMFVGSDWKGSDSWNQFEKDFAKVNVEIKYFDYTKGISSTKLRNEISKK